MQNIISVVDLLWT